MRHLKTTPFFMLLTSVFMCSSLLAGEKEDMSRAHLKLGINAHHALFGAFIGEAEIRLTDRLSLIARLAYLDSRASVNPNWPISRIEGPSAAGKLGFGLRGYWDEYRLDGIYAEGNIDTAVTGTLSLKEELDPVFGRVGPFTWRLYTSFYAGYAWVTCSGFFVDFALGSEISAVVAGEPDRLQFYFGNMVEHRVRLNVGWAF